MEVKTTDIVKESVKLTKNTKGYSWEIRIFAKNDDGKLEEADIERIERFDNLMKIQWGKKEESE